MEKKWNVYLAGEIHSGWRQRIVTGAQASKLPVVFYSPVTNHEASDRCGVDILGEEGNNYWRDHKSAKINAIRTRTLIRHADVVVVSFGDQYRQWNAAFDAGFAVALNKALIVLHDPGLSHALKEVDATSLAVAATPEEVVDVLRYVIEA